MTCLFWFALVRFMVLFSYWELGLTFYNDGLRRWSNGPRSLFGIALDGAE